MTDSNRNVSLGDVYPELATNLRRGAETPVDDLFGRATVLLRETGKKTYINNVPATATVYASATLELDGEKLYARIASYEGKLPEFIVFDETEDSSSIVSENPKALMFKQNIGDGSMDVFTNNGIEPIDGERRKQYVQLVKTIINDIAAQHAASQQSAADAKAARKQKLKRLAFSPLTKVRDYYGSKESSRNYNNLGRERMAKTLEPVVIVTVLLGVFYGPQIIAGDADARLMSIPLPQPIEAIVDFNNAPDHTAQGFSKPEGATPVTVGQRVTEIPLLAAYSTSDAPDASFWSGDGGYDFDESRPGLYASNFDATYHPEREMCWSSASKIESPCESNSAVFNENGCYVILGNYRTGATEVFTQTPGLDGKLTVEAADTKNLKVCLTDPKDSTTNGTLYVYQNH